MSIFKNAMDGYTFNCKCFKFTGVLFFLITFGMAEEVFFQNFDQNPIGIYSKSQMQADWNKPSWNDGVDEGRCAIVNSDSSHLNVLEVTYKENQYGPSAGGVQWEMELPGMGSYNELFMEYDIKFSSDFDFVKGGKLPGLSGGSTPSGGQAVSGKDGFTARLMWRRNSSGANSDQGYIVNYMYYMDMPETYGHDFWWDYPLNTKGTSQWKAESKRYFVPGQWHRVKNYLKMNTPGLHDGVIISWLDGDTAQVTTDIRFIAEGDRYFAIDKFSFSTFFGGSGSEWAPLKNEKVYFDNFRIWQPEGLTTQLSLEHPVTTSPGKINRQIFRNQVLFLNAEVNSDANGRKIQK